MSRRLLLSSNRTMVDYFSFIEQEEFQVPGDFSEAASAAGQSGVEKESHPIVQDDLYYFDDTIFLVSSNT